MGLTTDPNDPCLRSGSKDESGQQNCYLVLSEEERAKGFVRPYRDSYIHVGKDLKAHWKRVWYMVTEEDHPEHFAKGYVAAMVVIEDENGKPIGGPLIRQDELDAWKKGERFGGCGVKTIMGRAIAETYSVNPKFYSATMCVGCRTHLPVSEFLWEGTNEEVGS